MFGSMWGFLLLSVATAQLCDDECSRILGSTNEERKLVGAKPVCINAQLMRAAMVQAQYQDQIDKMQHQGPGGNNVGDRATAAGYSWSSASENVAMGQTTAKSVMLGWMNSEGHRKNILNPESSEMGIAHVGKFWAQVFGKPRKGAGGCNVGVVGGSLGTLEPKVTDSGPACDAFCQSVLQIVNSKRAMKGMSPLCLNGKLMTAAAKLAQVKSLGRLQEEVDATGFGTKGVGAAEHTIHMSRGLPTDKDILDMLTKDYRGAGNGKDFNRGGIAFDSRREFCVIIEAATYSANEDKCMTGSAGVTAAAAFVSPPAQLFGAVTTAPLLPPPASPATNECSKYTTPCSCTGNCGWSTGSGSCLSISVANTDCSECPTQGGCQPTSQCANFFSPCMCASAPGCGWSSNTQTCMAGYNTDCTECASQSGCSKSKTG